MAIFDIHIHTNLNEERIVALLDDLQANNASLTSAVSGVGAQLNLVQQAVTAEAVQGASTLAQIKVLQDQIAALPVGDAALTTAAQAVSDNLASSAANLNQLATGLAAVVAGIAGILPDSAPVPVPATPEPLAPPVVPPTA